MIQNSALVQRVLKRTFLRMLLLYGCSIPIFYVLVAQQAAATVYMTARILRLLVIVALACIMRKRNGKALTQNMPQRKKYAKLLLGIVLVSVFLLLNNTFFKVYLGISQSIGIYDQEITPFFLMVLWEQLFVGDLYWCILACLSVLFFIYQTSRVLTWPRGRFSRLDTAIPPALHL